MIRLRLASWKFLALFLVTLLPFTGCAPNPKPPSPEMRGQLGRIYVMAIPSSPQGEFHTFARGWAEGAVKGGSSGALQGMLHFLAQGSQNAGGGPYAAAAAAIAALIFTIAGSTIGGVTGTMQAVPAKTAREIEKRINTLLAAMDLSRGLAKAVQGVAFSKPELAGYGMEGGTATEARDQIPYHLLASRGIDTVLEIRVTEAGFQGGEGARPRIRFYMNAAIRLVDTRTGLQRFGRDFHQLSEELPFDVWFANGSQRLADEFKHSQAALAERIIDELFLVTDFPFASGLWTLPGQPDFGICWFAPISPKVSYTTLWYSIRHASPGISLLYPEVDSLQPLLEWEPFPRPRDITAANEPVLHRIGNVTYDLKIWEAPNDFPARLIYDRTGISVARYRPEYPLKPQTRYFWTIRARYTFSGNPQVTRWAFSLIPATAAGMPPGGSCDLDEIPSTNFFRFQTP